jgi:hypothetical protein
MNGGTRDTGSETMTIEEAVHAANQICDEMGPRFLFENAHHRHLYMVRIDAVNRVLRPYLCDHYGEYDELTVSVRTVYNRLDDYEQDADGGIVVDAKCKGLQQGLRY